MAMENRGGLSIVESARAEMLTAKAATASQAYKGDYKAPWLLSSSIYSDVWSLHRGSGETRTVDGKVIGDERFDWAIPLPDDSVLTDPKNSHLLQSIQRIAFVARATDAGPDALQPFIHLLHHLCFLAKWIVLQSPALQPTKFAFSKLKNDHIVDLMRDLAKGGIACALKCQERFLSEYYPKILSRSPTSEELNDPTSLNQEDCNKIRTWFSDTGQLKKPSRAASGTGKIRLSEIAKALSSDIQTLGRSPQFRAFLSQFEEGPLANQKVINRGKGQSSREFATQREKLAKDLAHSTSSDKTAMRYLGEFGVLVAVGRHLPELCPDPKEFRADQLRKVMEEIWRTGESTPWVPLNTALKYTTEAIRWVHVYGEALVEVYLKAFENLYSKELLGQPLKGNSTEKVDVFRENSLARDAIVASIVLPAALAPLKIEGWASYRNYRGTDGFLKLRSGPSLSDALMILIASISIITATLKPMRESELRRLRRGCIHFIEGDGYWLTSNQRKRVIDDEVINLQRPIPRIAAKAVLLLQRLTDGLKSITGARDPFILECLYSLPPMTRYQATLSPISKGQLNQLFDVFCDFVATEPDALARRWYIRVHELRKSFLITFFWAYRYSNLEAAAWMAGHADITEVYAYLHANFPGQELPALEAEFASRVLRSTSACEGISNQDIEKLHAAVCRHFQVNDVTWIEDKGLQEWLRLRFSSGEFSIHPFALKTPEGDTSFNIAFRVRRMK